MAFRKASSIGSSSLILALTVWAISCGGGSSGGSGGSKAAPLITATGQVVLPKGFTLPLNRLAVASFFSQTPVAANGSFTTSVNATGPSLVQLVDTTTNKIVLLGYVDAGASGSTFAGGMGQISASTSATALLYFGLEGFMMPSVNMTAFRSAIISSTQNTTVANVIATRVAADPTAITDGDAQIEAAVNVVQNTGPAVGASLRLAFARPQTISVTHVSVTRTVGASGDQILVQPSDQQSGVAVLNNNEASGIPGNGIIYTNAFRRRAVAYVYEVANVDANGNKTVLPTPKEVVTAFPVQPANSLNGVVGTLGQALAGNFAFLGVASGPTNLTVEPGEAQTDYDVIIVGPSSTDVADVSSPFLVSGGAQGEEDALITEWSDEKLKLTTQVLLLDVCIPLFTNFALGDSEIKDVLGERQSTLAADLGGIVNGIPDTVTALKAGKLSTAFSTMMTNIADSTELKQKVIGVIVTDLRLTAGPLSAKATAALGRLFQANCIIDKIDTALAAIDVVKVIHDCIASLPAESWTANVIPPKFTLTPATSTIDADGPSEAISVTTSSNVDLSQFLFAWSCTDVQGELTSTTNQTLKSGPIAESTVEYVGNTSVMKVGQSDTVTVQVFAPTDLTTPIAKATAKVTDGINLVCGLLPPPESFNEGAPPGSITTDKQLYHAGQIMTATFTIPLAGAVPNSIWQVSLQSVGTDHTSPANVISVDGAPPQAGALTDTFNSVTVSGNTGLGAAHAQTHVIKFQILTPTDISGNPAGYCATAASGPELFGTIIPTDGDGGSQTITFVDLSP